MNPTYENPDESTHGDRSNQTRHPGTPPANRNAHSDRVSIRLFFVVLSAVMCCVPIFTGLCYVP